MRAWELNGSHLIICCHTNKSPTKLVFNLYSFSFFWRAMFIPPLRHTWEQIKMKKKENTKYSKISLYLRDTQKLFVSNGQFCKKFLNFWTISFFSTIKLPIVESVFCLSFKFWLIFRFFQIHGFVDMWTTFWNLYTS